MMRNNSFPRWLAAASLLAIVAVVTGGAWLYRTQEEHLCRQAETELRSIAHLKADEIAAWRQGRLADAAVLMESPFLAEQVARLMASPHAENTKDMLTTFRSLQERYHYFDVLLVDADGKVRLRVGGSHVPFCPPSAQSVAEALRERRPGLTDIHAGTDELPPHISVIAPIFAKSGAADEQVGAIILLANVREVLYPLIQSWPTPSRSAETLLVRRDGDSVLFLNNLRHRKGAAPRLRIPLSRKDEPAVMAAQGRVGVVEGNDYRGVRVLSAVQPIPDSPWFMVAKVDAEEVLARWRFRSVLIVAMSLALVLAAVTAAGLVWQRNDKAHYRSLAGAQAELRESEENLTITLRSIGDGVIATDTEERITRMNPVAEALTGWRLDEVAGRPFVEVFHIINALTKEPAENPIAEALSSGNAVDMANDTALIARDGVERQIADSAAPIRDANGDIVGAVLVFHDVTQEYATREALRESEARLNQLAAQNRTIAWEVNTDGLYTHVSHVSEAVWGYRPDELVGRMHFYDLHPEAGREAFKEAAFEVFARKESFRNLENAVQTKDGRQVWVSTNGIPLLNTDGTLQGYRGSDTDITERKQAEEALADELVRRRILIEQSRDGIVVMDEDGKVCEANQRYCEMLGYSPEEVLQLHVWDWDTQWTREQLLEMIALVGADGDHFETRHRRKDGALLDVEISSNGAICAGQKLVFCVCRDISERKLAEEALLEKERRYRSLWESANEGFCLHDLVTDASGQAVDYRILEVNPAYERITSLKADDVVGRLASQVYGTGDAPYLDIYARVASTGAPESFEAHFAPMDKHLSISVFSPSPGLFATAFSDISERKVHEEVLSHQATHDSLTGLPNRECFERHLRERTASAAGQKRKAFDVVFMDLDKFKQINDTLGHNVGDLLLVAVADRLRSCLRSNDVLARMGGDEFTVIVESAGRRSFTESVLARITDSISRPFEVGGRKFVIGVSFGLAAYPSDGRDSVTLLKNADAAMYKAKEAGRGTFRWFTGEAEAENRQRADMEHDLGCALENNHLKVHYQPVVRLDDESLHGAEALSRWEHPKKGMISPSLFIPIAEEAGLIGSIGDYVLRTACSQTMAWRDEGMQLSQIGVNVSTMQIRDTSWLDSVRAAISSSGIDPHHLVLELTETDLAADYQSLRASLHEVQELGIGISIDDFGMGQSSLSRLKDFAVIELKIDGSFVRDIEHSKNDKALLNSIIQMAHDQGIKVTAEWVETEAQADILHSSGCDFAQGFFFSPPLPVDEFRAFALEQVPSAKRKRRAA